jgi:arylsulfatase A-like enzyme
LHATATRKLEHAMADDKSKDKTLVEYKTGAAFPGWMGRTIGESSPAWPAPVRAKPGAPNVLFIVLDDVGFAQLGCYGSPINTPNIDKLAHNGLLYTNMHTTALCSPSRSCFLTGRNHHSNGMSCITEGAVGFPGSNGAIPFENGFLSEILLGQGYNTYALGKWHLTPSEQISAAGPYDRWPLGRGFERYYGFLGGDTSQYYPDLVHDNGRVEPPKTPEEGYHLTTDLVDKAISFIGDSKQLAPASRSSSTSPPVRCMRRITYRRSGPTNTKGNSTTAGMPTARRSSLARKNWA